MSGKLTPTAKATIKKLRASGLSARDIAPKVGLSKSSVIAYLATLASPVPAAPVVHAPVAPVLEEPGDPLTSEELQALVSEQVSRQRDEAARCAAVGDAVGQQRAAKAMAAFATMLARMLPRGDDAGVIRVRGEDMAAAAQQTRDDLHRLLDRELERMREAAPGGDRPFAQVSLAQSWIRRLCSIACSPRSRR